MKYITYEGANNKVGVYIENFLKSKGISAVFIENPINFKDYLSESKSNLNDKLNLSFLYIIYLRTFYNRMIFPILDENKNKVIILKNMYDYIYINKIFNLDDKDFRNLSVYNPIESDLTLIFIKEDDIEIKKKKNLLFKFPKRCKIIRHNNSSNEINEHLEQFIKTKDLT